VRRATWTPVDAAPDPDLALTLVGVELRLRTGSGRALLTAWIDPTGTRSTGACAPPTDGHAPG